MWSYTAVVSLKIQLVKMKAYWGRTGPQSNITSILIKGEIWNRCPCTIPDRENFMWPSGHVVSIGQRGPEIGSNSPETKRERDIHFSEITLLTHWSWICSLQNYKSVHCFCLNYPVCSSWCLRKWIQHVILFFSPLLCNHQLTAYRQNTNYILLMVSPWNVYYSGSININEIFA